MDGKAAPIASDDRLILRPPQRRDGAALHSLVAQCPPLDLNSVYAYVLLCEHHGASSLIAESDGSLIGAVTAYRVPARPDTLFVWQVAVAPSMQGKGLGSRMLTQLVAANAVRYVEATISPSNTGSQKLFRALARHYRVPCEAAPYFTADNFGAHGHEEEWLYRLGPWPGDVKP